jgi:GntR family transcriptional regulator, arabinose operon transcriptional repressor
LNRSFCVNKGHKSKDIKDFSIDMEFISDKIHMKLITGIIFLALADMVSAKVTDIARELSMSSGTVSKALRGRVGQVSVRTAKKVLNYCTENSYISRSEANKVLTRIRAGRTNKQIFLITRYHGVYVYDRVFAGISAFIQENGAYLSTFYVNNVTSMRRFMFDKASVAILAGRIDPEIVSQLTDQEIPVVLVDNRVPGSLISSVNTNNMEAVGESVRVLAELGHTRIAFLCNHLDVDYITYTFHQREVGYMAGLAANGIPFDKKLLITAQGADYQKEIYDWKTCEEDLRSIAKRVLDIDPLPTAVITANDMHAYILREVLEENGIRVPEDISIIGYDGRHKLNHVQNNYPPVSTQGVDWYELGREAGELALNLSYDTQAGSRYLEVPTVYEDAGTVAGPRTEPPQALESVYEGAAAAAGPAANLKS